MPSTPIRELRKLDLRQDDTGFERPAVTVANAELMSALAQEDRDARCQAIEAAIDVLDPDALLELVADESNAVRRNAAMEVLERAGSRSIPALLKALKSTDIDLVMFAATVLGKMRNHTTVPHLIKLLDHPEINVVVAAVDSLGQLHARQAVPALAALLGRDPWLRFAAAHALGGVGAPEAVEILETLLDDPMLHDMVLAALGTAASTQTLPHLARRLHQADEQGAFDACLCAIAAILQRQPDLASLGALPDWARLRDPTETAFRQRLAAALNEDREGEFRVQVKHAASAVVCALRIEAFYPDLVRATATGEVGELLEFHVLELGAKIGPALIAGMLSPEAAVRACSCACLGTLGLSSSVTNLLIALDDVDASVRAAAIGGLTRMHACEAVSRIVSCLRDPAPAVRAAAREALAHLDPVTVSAALLGPQPTSREDVLAALDIFGDNPHHQAQAFLNACVRHPEGEVRRRAARALAQLPGFEHSPIPELLLADPDPAVRLETVRAMPAPRRLIIQSKLLAFVATDALLREQAIRSLGQLGNPAITTRVTRILLERPEICEPAVAEAVADLARPECTPLLVRLLAAGNAAIRRIALLGIGRIGSHAGQVHAAAMRDDPDPEVRMTAVTVLAGARDRDSLERLTGDPDPNVARNARRHLEDLSSVS